MAGTISIQKFASTNQRVAEVLLTTNENGVPQVKIRPTVVHFDSAGSLDLSHAAEAASVALEAHKFKKIDKNVFDMSPALRFRKLKAESTWSISKTMNRAIRDDIDGKIQLPILRPSKN